LLVVAVLVLLSALLPQFRAGEVAIEGARILDPGDVLAVSGLKQGQHLLSGIGGGVARFFSLRYGAAEDRLLSAFPYLREVEARMEFPGRIRILLAERVEVGYIAIPDGCALIDAEGITLDILTGSYPQGIPVIAGLVPGTYALGRPLEVNDPEALQDAMVVLDAVLRADTDLRGDMKLIGRIRSVRPVARDAVYLTVLLPSGGEELMVRLHGVRKAPEDMEWLRFALMQGRLDGLGPGVLELSEGQRVFRPDPG